MGEMLDSIVVKRLVRNLRYRQTYVEVFQSFLEPAPSPEVARLMHALIRAQQSAIVLLSGHLQELGVPAQDLPLVQKLLGHAASRDGVRSRLHFVHYGLTRAASWYREQLMDRKMIADPELKRLLFELGEGEAACLWRTEAVMILSGMSRDMELMEQFGAPLPKPVKGVRRLPRQPGSRGRPVWSDARPTIRSRK